jgi:hypothetical protein
MGRALEHVKEIISSEADQARKEELRTELFDQILDEVGDEDKVFAMRWWFEKMQVEEGGEVADDFIEARL